METKPSLDVVLAAVSALYNPNTSGKEEASQWLGDLQKSVHAWEIADELLRQKRDLESCYFGAQTMRTKIHQSFHELPANVHSSLRDSLLEHISQITEGTNTVIVTQLCLALADLALQMPEWQHACLDLINRFSQTNICPLLEILTVLPEELESRSIRLGENRRMALLTDLTNCAPTVSNFLNHCSHTLGNDWQENIQMNIKIFRCFTSWVSVGAITLNDVVDNVVIARAFEVLNYKPEGERSRPVSGALHDAAADCICTLLHCLEDNNNQLVLENYLFTNIVNLEMVYHLSVANEDQERSINYCRLFTELGESFLERMINTSGTNNLHYLSKILDLVLICVGHHEYEVAEITFNLWYVLSDELYQKNDKDLKEQFRPYVERLITALCRHCQMEPDHEGLLEDGDDFRDFRIKVSELIRDIVYIVGRSNCFKQMYENLRAPGATWDTNEAALFVMSAIAKNVLPTDNEVVPKLVEAILALPENTHIAVKYTSVLLLGELCEWMEKHPQTLDPILNFLVCCLSQHGVGAAAATALQNICATCNEHMARHVPVLLHLLQQVDTFAITNNAVIGLLKGVAAIVGCMPHSELTGAMRQLCLLQSNPLMDLINKDIVPVMGTTSDPVLWLDRLSAVLRYTVVQNWEGPVHPAKPVILEVWPVLSHTFDKYQSDVRIMERCCRSVRFMLRCVSQQICELLEDLVSQIVRIYAIYKHSCCLYVGSILVDEYGGESNCFEGLLRMLEAFIQPTFHLLQETNGLRNHPDTVDDFFRLVGRFIQRAPVPFLQCAALRLIVECGLTACTLDHKDANTSVMKFFYDVINAGEYGRTQPDYKQRRLLVKNILNDYGQSLVTNLLHACVFYLHSYMLNEVADVFVELLKFDMESTEKWLAHGLEALPKGTNGIMVTPEQLNDVHGAITRSDTSKSLTHALKDLTRFYR